MYTLRKQFKFEASHQLVGHDGKCARLHGHSWVGWVEIRGADLIPDGPKEGMVADYYDIATPLKGLVEDVLDHHHLNDSLMTSRPTSEVVATIIYQELKPTYDHLGIDLVAVEIEETCTSSCRFEP